MSKSTILFSNNGTLYSKGREQATATEDNRRISKPLQTETIYPPTPNLDTED